MATSPDTGGVARTLDELERKLRDLERELGSVTAAPAVAPTPPPPPEPPPPPRPEPPADDPRERLRALSGQVDELERFREQLQRTARELEDEYARLLSRLGSVPAPAATDAPPPPPSPAPSAAGLVLLDAGPFADIAALGAFEQALERLPAVEDVYVSGFQGRRATVELRLTAPIALVAELRAVVPSPFTVREEAPERLTIDLLAPEAA